MKDKSALTYCQTKYVKSLKGLNGKKENHIKESFEALGHEIKKLDPMVQINLYSATTQLLDALVNETNDSINPLDVFHLRCQSILNEKYNASYHIVLGLTVIVIACAALVMGGTLGIGIGVLAGLWQTPLVYMASLLVCELPALGVAALSTLLSIGAGVSSGYFFFKEPKVKTEIQRCIEVIKESYLEENPEETEQEELVHSINP